MPRSAWTARLHALAPALSLDESLQRARTPLEKEIAALPEVLKALSDEADRDAVFIERLPGADVYLAYEMAGTLDCQAMAFVRAEPHRPARVIAGPPRVEAQAEGDFCWTEQGQAGSVFGRPAFVATTSFTVNQPPSEAIEITPWTGSRWGAACRLELDYRTKDRLSEQFCGDERACDAVAPLAVAIAEAHRRPRKDGEPFRFDDTPLDAGAIAAVRGPSPNSYDAPELPTFGETARTPFTGFSYGDLDYFPLTTGGVRYVAAAGYGGVGWREIGDALIAVYAASGGVARPVAGFVVTRSVVGLKAASIGRPEGRRSRP